MADNCLLSIKGLNVFYGHRQVLTDIDLCLKKADFLGIIGPNGAGKTTLFKAILGVLPYKGDILLDGRPIAGQLDRIGYVPQQVNIARDFPITVLELCMIGLLSRRNMAKKFSLQDKVLAKDMLDLCGYNDDVNKRFAELSLGQKQRVLIARGLMKHPEILLLDEPTASIDVAGEDNVFGLLERLNEKGMTIVMISHDVGVLSVYVDKIACLNNTLVYHGSADSLPQGAIEDTYKCPVDIIAHGAPHRVLRRHEYD